ncbi:MAG: FixH family protein [Mesorhizobium sp.]|nr:FixH family protein [Mesorhizobium sp.]
MNGHQRRFTGTHMLAIMVAFFSVIIAVNLTMAFFARSSWSGFVVENTYVASQQFNRKAAEGRAQAALGWKPELTMAGGEIRYRLIDGGGDIVAASQVTAHFRRPVSDAQDQELVLAVQPDGSFSAPVDLGDGAWIVEIHSEAGIGHPYRDVRRLSLQDGG